MNILINQYTNIAKFFRKTEPNIKIPPRYKDGICR